MLTIKKIHKNFGSCQAVIDLSLELAKGEIFGFLGPNGAGKTTTIKMIAGLLHPSSGQILIDAIDVHLSPVEAKQHLAYIPDEPYLYEKLTGYESLQLIGKLRQIPPLLIKKRIEELLSIFSLEEFAHQYTENYSHGTRQKFVFACALLSRPQLLLIDEPMVGLDPQNSFLVKNLLRQVATQNQVTIFLSTHTLSLAEEICDQIGIINHGQLLACDTIPALKKQAHAENMNLEQLFLSLTGQANNQHLVW
jgi:ABC-2 type transport system ATP-binding protein